MNDQLKILPLSKKPEYYPSLIKLIEKSFHYEKGNFFEKDFLPLVHPSNWEHCYLLFLSNENELIGHIGVLKKELHYQNVTMPVLFLGGICIEEKYQGQGYFRSFFQDILSRYQKEVALYFLWSNESDLYKKFDFKECGRIIQTGPEEKVPGTFFKESLKELSTSDREALIELHQETISHFIHVIRTRADWEIIFQMESVDVYIKRESNEIVAYFFKNKGQDLTGIIHEVGAKDLEVLTSTINELASQKLWLPYNSPFELAEPETIFFLGLVKVGNKKLLNPWLLNIAPDATVEEMVDALYIPGVASI